MDFTIGPDKGQDIRESRPYFSVQLEQGGKPICYGEPGVPAEPSADLLLGRITEYARLISSQAGPVTDIYFLSHGWHRNYYAATSAYDRLVCRFVRLLGRGVLEHKENFNPLILGAHWHSDPGEDKWIDPAGRRDKISFMQNVEMMFEHPSDAEEANTPLDHRFTTVFEQCFAFFGRMSAADTEALSDRELTAESAVLAAKIAPFALRDAAAALESDKVIATWTCYHESVSKQVVTDQEIPPTRGMTPGQAVKNVVRFTLGAIGIAAVFGAVIKSGPVTAAIATLGSWLTYLHNLIARPKPYAIGVSIPDTLYSLVAWMALVLILLVITALVGSTYLWILGKHEPKPRRIAPFWNLAAWAPVQILLSLPVLTMAFVTYFFSMRNTLTRPGVFSERIGRRNATITQADVDRARQAMNFPRSTKKPTTARQWAAWLATLPIYLYQATLSQTNPAANMFAVIENELAFYDMQIRGSVAGATAAQFLCALTDRLKPEDICIKDVRIHLIGHSFGGLVILNAARHLALYPACMGENSQPKVQLQSLTLLQAALASNWLEDEPLTISNIKGAIACGYSAYDTANSFYYPIANGGRFAAGYVGLCGVPDPSAPAGSPAPAFRIPRLVANNYHKFTTERDDKGLFALLVSPPHLSPRLPVGPLQPVILNLDASRLVYQGPIVEGGGHCDIYKDDVINLVWSVTKL